MSKNKKKMVWDVRRIEWDSENMTEFLNDGWEPFAASEDNFNAYLYLRKKFKPYKET